MEAYRKRKAMFEKIIEASKGGEGRGINHPQGLCGVGIDEDKEECS